MHVITCYFNPSGYSAFLENYHRFRTLLPPDLPLTTVELSFNGKFEIEDSIKIVGNDQNIMWQKERLLNIAFEHVPADEQHIAWIDADVQFLNPNWVAEAQQTLSEYPVIQLFEFVEYLDIAGRVTQVNPSLASCPHCKHVAPGMAWAARREIFPLYDRHIVGGGDRLMTDAWMGNFDSYLIRDMSLKWRRQFLNWGAKSYNQVKGRVGHVPGKIQHFFHGDLKNRQYRVRNEILKGADYDPNNDVTINERGALEWTTNKPSLHSGLKRYFDKRQDDSGRKSRIWQIGFAKTATNSLAMALRQLGIPTLHDSDICREIVESDFQSPFLHDFEAFTDGHFWTIYQDLAEKFPNDKFILTTRDLDEWVNSCLIHVLWARKKKVGDWFEFDTEKKRRQHEQFVKEAPVFFADQPERLLIMDIPAGDGWEKLCPFLGKEVPDAPFPYSNTGAARLKELLEEYE